MTSAKSVTGHLLGASSAVEAIATILALRDGTVPPTRNLDALDDEVDLDDVVAIDPRPVAVGAALSNSFGFRGSRRVPGLHPVETGSWSLFPTARATC